MQNDKPLLADDIKDPNKMLEELNQQADKSAAETIREFDSSMLTPEMIKEILAQQNSRSRGFYTRGGPSHMSNKERKDRRKRQRRARAITRNTGMGRTVSKKKRDKKVA